MPSKHTLPKLEGVTNFRELGGLQTRDGHRVRARRVFRSGHWGGATASDQALMRELEIGRVFDFRSQVDLSYDGQDKLPEEVEHIALPTSDPAMIADVRKQVAESGPKVLYEIFGEGRHVGDLGRAEGQSEEQEVLHALAIPSGLRRCPV